MNKSYIDNIKQAIQNNSLAMILGNHFEQVQPWEMLRNGIFETISQKSDIFNQYIEEIQNRELPYDILFRILHQNNGSVLDTLDGFKVKQTNYLYRIIAEMIQQNLVAYLGLTSIDNRLSLALQEANLKYKINYTTQEKEENKPLLHWIYGRIDEKKTVEEYLNLNIQEPYLPLSYEFFKNFKYAEVIVIIGLQQGDFGWRSLYGMLKKYALQGKQIYWITDTEYLPCTHLCKIGQGGCLSMIPSEFLELLFPKTIELSTENEKSNIDFSKSLSKFENNIDIHTWHLLTGILLNQVMSRSHANEVLTRTISIFESKKDYRKAASAYHHLGIVLLEQGFQKRALEAHTRSIELWAELKDSLYLAHGYAKCAENYENGCDLEKAIQYYGDALSLYCKSKNQEGMSKVSARLALICEYEDDFDLAQSYYQDTFHIKLENFDYRGAIVSFVNYCNCIIKTKAWEKAVEKLHDALQLSEQYQEPECLPEIYQMLGLAYMNQQDYVNSRKYYEEAFILYKSQQDLLALSFLYCSLGHVCARQEDYETAIKYYEDSMEYYEKMGDWQHLASIYTNLGLLYTNSKKYDIAEEYFSRSEEIFAALGDVINLIKTHTNLAKIYTVQGQFDNALECYNANVEMLLQIGIKEELATTCISIAMIYLQKHKFADAIKYLDKALNLYKGLGKTQEYQDTLDVMCLIQKQ
ncbi:MAG: tetratricopeptide repeat protein [Planctomycetes bacterium]|nr:tetratricopeptide repeat protein [Planctomycetota bacterium]HPY74287.1 tetratricopeptide repeat protein [Planctomycetota bacterium]HQA99839.1 tetratricopeptide repeat protein [Planctomycetota bacterium]HRU50833.1 tetratricopeptide repeat protein [Planctomycetota bacterium]